MKQTVMKAIRSDKDYEAALERMAGLTNSSKRSENRNELEILYDLVEHYEDRHHRIDAPSPAEAIKFRIEQGGVNQSVLVNIFGSAAKFNAVLAGRRRLTPEEIVRLHTKLGIPLESLLSEYPAQIERGRPLKTAENRSRAYLARRRSTK